MPMWAPPTPPTSENDIYLDPALAFWYEPSVMHEARLPPVFIKKEPKRLLADPIISASSATRKQKVRKDDMVNIPRSLFDRPSAAILKMRREVKLQKVKGLIVGTNSLTKPVSTFSGLKQPSIVVNKPTPDAYQDKPEWLVYEDFSILQVIQDQQGIPLSLTILMPAHTPNWDLTADVVNTVSRVYRSARLCKTRYENVIMLREEGKILYDTNPKKPKKTKGIYKTKNNRPMKTSHLYQQDNNGSFTGIFGAEHKIVNEMAQKRKLSERQSGLPTSKGPKMVSVLSENGINYEDPLNPTQIAANRAERIAREKQKNQPSTGPIQAGVASQVPTQTAVQVAEHPVNRQVQQQSTVTVASLIPHQAQAVIASIAQAQQLQQVQLSKSNLQPGSTVTAASLAKSLSSSGIMVNATPGTAAGTFATITKALGQAGVSSISAQGAVHNAAIAAALSNANIRSQRTSVTGTGTTTTITMQDMVAAAAAAGQVRSINTTSSGTSTAPAVVSVAGLATVQLAASQRITGTAATTVAAAVANQVNSQITTQRNLTQLSQIQAIRQTALIRQREQQQNLKQQQQLKRLQVQQAASQPVTKVSVGGAGTLTQQRPQQVTMKQSRPLTDAEMTQLVKRQHLQQQQKQVQLTTAQILAQAQLQQVQPQQVSITGGTATLVKTVSAPTSVAIPVSAVTMGGVNINVSLPQGKTGAVQSKGATTITNQQLRQFQIQQQILNQARKGSKVATNLTQLTKVSNKTGGIPTASMSTAVQIVQHSPSVGTSQQVKGLPAAMTVQQIQQAMKAMPQNLPVVVTATPSIPGIQHTTASLRGEPVMASSVKAQTTTLPSTTLTTSGVLKGTPAVVMGQQQTAAILQQVAASSAALSGQHAVTLAVRASQAQGQQVQIQVQPSAHASLVSPQSQVVSPQARIQQLSQNASTINIAPPVAAQTSSILSPPTIVQQMPADSTIQSPTHVVMHSVAITHSTPTASPQTTSVQAVIQAARQQQAAQQQKASPYTMRLRNPPK